MNSLKKSCLRWTLVYLILGALLSWLVYQRVPQTKLALGCGFGAAVLVWFSIGYVAGIGARRAEARMMETAMRGERPSDGEKIAVVGTIASSFETLEAPMSKRRCVAYEYKAIPETAEEMSVIDGFALVPLSIDGPRGSIRLLASPDLDFPFEVSSRLEQYDNFREYIAQTQFEQLPGINIKRDLARLKTVLADDDGRIHYDTMRTQDVDVSKMKLEEKILAPGEHVVAIGRYSAAKNALVPDADAILYPVKITKGEPKSVKQRGRGKDVFEMFLGCGCLVPVLIAAILGLANLSLDAIEQQFPAKDPSWTEVRVERWIRRDVRPLLSSQQSEYAITLPEDAARGKLTANGKTLQLTRASAKRDDDVIEVRLLTDGNEGVVARIRRDHTIASLQILGGGAFNAADAEMETFAFDDERVNGRITALSPGDGPKLRAMFRARF
ncbi:MAG: hypothetical protein DMF56_22225 [Acidobacteria bacterium]|nr:MAG: hypothetical protein DMF56_22225 [Acidobacteriota bacterium]